MNALLRPRKPLLLALLLGAALLAGCVGAGNFVWLDENGNGVQDAGEPGVEGVPVTLFAEDGTLVGSTTTDASGSYQIVQQGASAGNFYVGFDPPAAYEFTLPDQGSDDTLDSDVDASSGETAVLALSGVDANVDAGLVQVEAVAEVPAEEEATATPTATPTPTPEVGGGAALEPFCYGPLAESFPEGYSPLSGLPVSNPALLSYRPVFLSISIFPPSVRPPTGLSVSPII